MGRDRRTGWVSRMQAIVLFLVLQVGWFSCVLGAAWGLPWLGPAIVAMLVALHLGYSRSWRRDLELMIALGLFGLVFETLHAASGLIVFKGQVFEGQVFQGGLVGSPGADWALAPPWILALWVHFGTMRHSLLRLLFGRPWVAALCGAIFGPLAYVGGAALGAAVLTPPPWRALTVIAVAWALTVPAASFFAWRGAPLHTPRR